MKILVYGTLYVGDPARAELTEMWIRLNRHIYPDADLLLVDSQSDEIWCSLIPSLKGIERVTVGDDDTLPPLKRGLNWMTFPDNVGHLDHNGKDGWGRAFCRGLQYAADHGYDYALHIEADLLCRISLMPWIEQMEKHKLGVLTVPSVTFHSDHIMSYDFPEVGLMVWSGDYIRSSNFVQKYNWRERTKHPNPEHMVRILTGDDLFYKSLSGCRDDHGGLRFYDQTKIIYMTHAKDPALYHYFMSLAMPEGWQLAA